jgi:hypothetical protein
LAARDARGARSRFVYLLQDTPRISQEEQSGCTQPHAARETFEQLETEFPLQVLNLAGKGGLCHAQPACCTPVMLLVPDGQEISQMPQFHVDTLSRLI